MTVYAIKLSTVGYPLYRLIHTFDHVQMSEHVVAIDTELAPEDLAEKFAPHEVSVEVLLPGQAARYGPVMSAGALRWLRERGF